MASRYGRTPLLVWDEDDYTDLTPAAQHLDYVMRHDPTLSPCGRVDWRPARIAAKARGWTVAQIEDAAAELEAAGFACFDAVTEEAVTRRHIRWDEPLRNPKMAIALCRAYGAVASKRLRAAVVTEVRLARELHPEFSSWTSPLSAEQVTRLLGLPSLEDLGITNGIGNRIGFPATGDIADADRFGSPIGSVIEDDDSNTNPDDSITNGIANRIGNPIRSGSPATIHQSPVTTGGYVTGERHQAPEPERNDPPPNPPSDHDDPDGEPSPTCPRHPDGNDTGEPCRGCRTARETAEHRQADRDRATAAKQAADRESAAELRRAAIAACPLGCAETGGYIGTRVCDHDPGTLDRARRGSAAVRAALAAKRGETATPTPEPAADPEPPPTATTATDSGAPSTQPDKTQEPANA
ncbi:hypothetical protein [Nocardia sp. NPDC050793]|uniref:hypothetical protein n=1 Tax=Nocardia sp. NPDC050793 TaxID=3155159 RepID=UPI0033F1A2F1